MTDASPQPTGDYASGRITDKTLGPHTTLRLGGPARELVEAHSSTEAVEALRGSAEPTLVLAGGSNVVVGDSGFEGTVVLLRGGGIEEVGDETVRVEAGQVWDEFAAWTVEHGLSGIECLSGIPGSSGATPIQNVGAYGQEVSQSIASVRVWDRRTDRIADWSPTECRFAYRHSVFKHQNRYFVMSVDFRLASDGLSRPIAYAELARRLGVEVGERAGLREVREAVVALRRGKGMVLDENDHDSWSAGSFFTNPVLSAGEFRKLTERVGGDAPHWPVGEDVKVSAAWLIGAAGFDKGYTRGNVGLSTKHTLALTNRGGATTAELLALAREVADTVEMEFGVRLRPEPVLVGATWG